VHGGSRGPSRRVTRPVLSGEGLNAARDRHHLAKEGVVSSSLVSRSSLLEASSAELASGLSSK
jgi:hypothetical protein